MTPHTARVVSAAGERMATVTLTEFLLARIAETEAMPGSWIVNETHAANFGSDEYRRQRSAHYADHPDYREEWKP